MKVTKYRERNRNIDFDTAFLGIRIDEPLLEYLRLYSLSNGKNVSAVVNEAVDFWKGQKDTYGRLIKKTRTTLLKEWKNNRMYYFDFDDFLEKAEKTLKKKKIKPNQIKSIIKSLKEWKERREQI